MAYSTPRPSKIISAIKKISAKDQASSAIAVNNLSGEEQKQLLKSLEKIERESLKKDREEKNRDEEAKIARETRFICRLEEKLKTVINEEITVKTRFNNAKKLCKAGVANNEAALIEQFQKLKVFIADLEVLACLARKKQAEVIATLQDKLGLSIKGVSEKLGIDEKFAQRLFTFHKLIAKYPSLVITGYSFETLLTYKTVIEKRAMEKENFASRIELDVKINFEGEDDDILLDETTEEIGNSSISG